MSLRVVALRIRKELAGWLQRHCSDCQILVAAEGDALRLHLIEARKAWNDTITYDVKGVNPQDATSVIVESLRQLGVSRVVVIMGEFEAPLIAEAGLSDLERILGRAVVTEEVLPVVGLGLIGESVVDFTASGDYYNMTVSGAGRFLKMPMLLQQRFPGGRTYRERLC
jgi:hypothetical protein